MSLIRPTAPLFSGEPIATERRSYSSDSFIHVRAHRQPEPDESPAPEDIPATRADIAELAEQIAELRRRDAERAAAIDRIEAGVRDLLDAVGAIKARMGA